MMDHYHGKSITLAPPYAGSCALSSKKGGLALRGLFVLLMVPLVLWAIWKKRRR